MEVERLNRMIGGVHFPFHWRLFFSQLELKH